MIDYREHITVDYRIMLGKPIIKGTRITIALILKKLAEGMEIKDVIEAYPHLKEENIRAALAYSSAVVAGEELLDA